MSWKAVLAVIVVLAMVLIVAGMPRGTEAGYAIDGEEQVVLTLINDYRTQNGLGTLSFSNELNNATDWMSHDMAAKNYVSHTDSLGRDPFQRMDAFGYYNDGRWRGENLAAGTETAKDAFDLWRSSPGHNANMLKAEYVEIGIARAYNFSSTHHWYWTTDFGGQGSVVLAPPLEPTPRPIALPLEPTLELTLEPTPEPTLEPTPVPPSRAEIESQLMSLLGQLSITEVQDSVLRTMSYFAEQYLVVFSYRD